MLNYMTWFKQQNSFIRCSLLVIYGFILILIGYGFGYIVGMTFL